MTLHHCLYIVTLVMLYSQQMMSVTLSKLLAWLIYAEGVFLQGSLMELVKAIVRGTGQCQLAICQHAVLSLCRTLVV